MASFYSASDMFVLGSHHEGSGYALIEAVACGCVPVVTNIPSFRAITGNGVLGKTWSPGDIEDCRRALVDAASTDFVAARRSILDYFERELSWVAVAGRARRAYEDVIARKRLKTVGVR